jgi:CheY-like chemotaxis protein
MAEPLILLADDDMDFLSLAEEYLTGNGYRVECATTPGEAKAKLETMPLALAFIDCRLLDNTDSKDSSGINVAIETINTSATYKIILTGVDDREPSYNEYMRLAMKPRDRDGRDRPGGRPAVVDFIQKKHGLPKMLDVIRNTLSGASLFLSYVSEDRARVTELYAQLESAGYSPWIDHKDIVKGEVWADAIERAVNAKDFCLVCISNQFNSKRGYQHKEVRLALERLEFMREQDIYLIPLMLENCEIENSKLKKLQRVDLFEPDGFNSLVQALKEGMMRRY